MTEALANLGVITAFFLLDWVYRQVGVRESGYLALDFALFALLKTGFDLVDQLRIDGHIESVVAGKLIGAFIFYTCLIVLYSNLQRAQMRRIDDAFTRFHEHLADLQDRETAQSSPATEELLEHHHDQRLEVDAVKAMAEETIWINVFRKEPLPAKLARARDLVALLQLVVAEMHVPEQYRIKPENLYLQRSWKTALAAGAATFFTGVAAVIPT